MRFFLFVCFEREQPFFNIQCSTQASLSDSVIDTIIYTVILRTVPVKCHGDDTPLFSLLILLVHVSKFNVHNTPTEIEPSRAQ